MWGSSSNSALRRVPSVTLRSQVGFQRDSIQWRPTPRRSSSYSPTAAFNAEETQARRQSADQSSAAHSLRSSCSIAELNAEGISVTVIVCERVRSPAG
jgi:hypothetical protein